MILPPDDFMPESSGDSNGTRRNRKIYAAEIHYMDSQIGRLLDHLTATGIDDRTFVIVVSDHGEGLGNHGWGKHRILYQEQIRLPLIIRIPGRDQVPVVSALVRSIDIFPTILDYLGIDAHPDVTGQSMRGLIEGHEEPGRVALADQINGFDLNADMVEARPLDDFLYSAMDQDWKLIYRPTNPDASELYDLSHDPNERQNLYVERPGEAQRLLAILARSEPWVMTPFTPAGDAGDLEAIQKALAALGYLGGSDRATAGLDWAWACPDNLRRLRGDRRQGDCSTPLVPVLPRPDNGS
jgi:arylsulfatase A-like enzyme